MLRWHLLYIFLNQKRVHLLLELLLVTVVLEEGLGRVF